jgi:hypothetical protein
VVSSTPPVNELELGGDGYVRIHYCQCDNIFEEIVGIKKRGVDKEDGIIYGEKAEKAS